MSLPPDTVLEQRYRVIKEIGRGGMGRVYLIEDQSLPGRQWALKEMLPGADDDKSYADQFRREAEILCGLRHPNLPAVIAWFVVEERRYLVMEYVEGQTLEQVLQRTEGFLDEAKLRHWGVQLCDTLHYLHTQVPPIIYRDIKPGNIIVTPSDTVKLIDFGIARLFGEQKQADTIIIGTPGFASPEQYGRGQTDPRSDVYSLGATLYNLATRLDPAENPFDFRVPSTINPALSNAFDNALLKALNLKPADRFQTAAELREALASRDTVVLPFLAAPSASSLSLEIVPSQLSLQLPDRRRVTDQITITNSGGRFLTARISSNRPWLRVSPDYFEANQQTIQVTVDVSREKRALTHRGSIIVETDERAFPIPVVVHIEPTVWDTVIPRTGISAFLFTQAVIPMAAPFGIAYTYVLLDPEEKARQRKQTAAALALAVLNTLHFMGVL
ncbi:MAG: serine/threonine protein kinase [Candidatus Xenobia bacterium]